MKKVICAVLLIGFALAVIFGQLKPFELKVNRYEDIILPVEHTLPEKLKNTKNLDLLFYDGEYAVFTVSRDMENQRMTGPASETADIYVYSMESGIILQPRLNLYEGIINSAVFDGASLYYTVYYPYEGRAAVVMDDGGKINEYKVYEVEYDASARWDSPLSVDTDGEFCYFQYRDDSTDTKIREVFILNGQLYEEFTTWHVQPNSGNYNFDLIINDIKNPKEYEYTYGSIAIDYARGHSSVEIMEDTDRITWAHYQYWPGDMYLITGESIFSLERESPVTSPYKNLYISMNKDKQKEMIDTYSPVVFATNGKDTTFIHSDDGITQKNHLIKVNKNKVGVYPVDIAPDEVIISDNNAVFLIKGEENRIYTLK